MIISIVLASRLSVIREGMKRVLRSQEDIKVVAEVEHPQDVGAQGPVQNARVLVLAHPSASGSADLLQYLHKECPSLRVIVVTNSPTLPQILAHLRMGARGLLNASCTKGHLATAIRAVALDKIYLHEDLSRRFAADMHNVSMHPPHHSLSPRELQIFTKLGAGQKVTQIADELDISVKTVSTHKSRLMEKMGMASISQLIQYAVLYKIFDSETSMA